VVLFAGRLEPLKGADTLIEAVAEMDRDPHLADCVCLFIGGDSGDGARASRGGERDRLERLAAAAGISDRVRFLGAVSHERLARFYALAEVCVVPSRVETFGLVALEAQAQGTPVVAARVGGLPEVVADGETGTLVDGHEPREYCAAISALLHDDAARRRMGEAARRRAATFSWDRMVDRLLSIYGRVSSPEIPAELPCGYEVSLGSG
jgi:D-inositol-3-phosphate glycosyltransferase